MTHHPVTAHVLRVGPHDGAHRVATRAAVSVLVPLLVLVLLDRTAWTPYASFGAFTSLYGRSSTRPERAGMQAAAGLSLCLAVAGGVLVSLLPAHQWWMVGVGALVAAGGSIVSTAWGWHPPGPLFLLFGFTVCAMLPGQHLGSVPLAFAVAGASALFAMLVGWIGNLWTARDWSAPRITRPSFAAAVEAPGARRQLVRYLLGVTAAGVVAELAHWRHPYWAMVAVCAGLAGADRSHRLARSLLRSLGTLGGVVVAGLLLWWHPPVLALVAIAAALQFGAELLVGRNYGLALLCVTPLAIIMGEIGQRHPLGPLLTDRALETLLGAACAVAVLYLVPDPRAA